MKKRAILIVLDSAGIGALPDAADFGDVGANTICNIFEKRGRLDVPNMRRLGLAHIDGCKLPKEEKELIGSYCKCAEQTHAKDTTCGHWEMAGLALDEAFKTYPNGFPKSLKLSFQVSESS